MKIEFDLSDKAVKMIKALQVLSGEENSSISLFISEMIENGLKDRIASEIGVDLNSAGPMVTTTTNTPTQTIPPARRPMAQPQQEESSFFEEDMTGISDGLGDEVDDTEEGEVDEELQDYQFESEEIQGESDPLAFVHDAPVMNKKASKKGRGKASSAAAIDEEGGTDSPIHQRPASEQARADQNPEETFSQMALNMPFSVNPAPGEELDPRARRRMHRNSNARRASVDDFSGDNAVEAFL